jgi:mgtE-like transporter
VITTAGDILTLPALVIGTLLIGIPIFSSGLAVALALVAVAAIFVGFRLGAQNLRRILAESLPILAFTGAVTILVGIALGDRRDQFLSFAALLILLPPFLQEGGALGGILSSQLSSKVHLGLLAPRGLPPLSTFRDCALVYTFAAGVYLFVGGASHFLALALGQNSPGFLLMLAISALAGLIATTAAVFAVYYGSIVSYRFGSIPTPPESRSQQRRWTSWAF